MENTFEAIVIGAGHAGCESALALARKNHKTLLTTLNLDSVAFLACNPSIGGTAKGQLVSEIDALGGEMGVNADETLLQIRMLNRGKGVAVQSLRAQSDKNLYHARMKQIIEDTPNLTLKQAEAIEILCNNNKVIGIKTAQGETYYANAIVVATGVYLNSKIFIGSYSKQIGPNGFSSANSLTQSLIDLGFDIVRFKTGTPARINGNTIDYSKLEIQLGEDDIQTFSFITKTPRKNIAPCYVTYTNETTHEIIRNNLQKSAMYSGEIVGVGPRYCPSIESKIVRFADKERHQLFLEPEGLNTKEVYIQGASTSLPVDIQAQMYRSIKGLENAQIMRDAYAIEYDAIDVTALKPTLESKKIEGLFFAGQVNGTSGYEEAGAQGIIAGINAGLKLENKPGLVLGREDAYIGVLIDDLVTKGTNEPYRMMTSRAEYRLHLRQDNADLRLTQIGKDVGLVNNERWEIFENKQKQLNEMRALLKTKIKIDDTLKSMFNSCNETIPNGSLTIKEILTRVNIDIETFNKYYSLFSSYPKQYQQIINTEIKYEGYIKQQKDEIAKDKKQNDMKLDENIDYESIKGLRIEARQKLNKIKPTNIGQASRISGVSPADISVLIIYLKTKK